MSAPLPDSTNVEKRVLKILRDILMLDDESIDLDVVLTENLAPDSLDQMRLYMALEDEFQDTIPEDKMEEIKTVRDIIRYIEANHRDA
jgi:acyl carrier protein